MTGRAAGVGAREPPYRLTRRVSCAFALLSMALAGAEVRAEDGGSAAPDPSTSWRLGLMGGWLATAGDFDVLAERTPEAQPGSAPLMGLRAAFGVAPTLELGLELGFAPAPTGRGTAWLLPAWVTLAWRPLDGPVTPIAALGGGIAANLAGAGDVDALVTLGLGVEWRFADAWAVRIDAWVLATDGVDQPLSFTPLVTIGVDVFSLGSPSEPDDVEPHPRDPRPTRAPLGCPAGADRERCVDSDGDQVLDVFDRCPTERGEGRDGCPDPDGDGVRGLDDACPDRRGAPRDWGCPVKP